MPDQNRATSTNGASASKPGDPRIHRSPPLPPVPEPKPRDLSDDRLDAPIYVITVEHLGLGGYRAVCADSPGWSRLGCAR